MACTAEQLRMISNNPKAWPIFIDIQQRLRNAAEHGSLSYTIDCCIFSYEAKQTLVAQLRTQGFNCDLNADKCRVSW